MPTHISRPAKSERLRPFIDEFIVLEIEAIQLVQKAFVPKNGVVWALTSTPVTSNGVQFDNFLIGMQTRPLSMQGKKGRGIFIKFSPYGMSRFTGMPVDALTNMSTNSDVVWGAEACALRKQLLPLAEVEKQIACIEAFLMARFRPPSNIEQTIFEQIDQLSLDDEISITELKQSIPLSNRQLERTFKKLVGVNLQTYRRILRFQKAFYHMQFQEANLTQVGYDSGYFDQSHFSRDFKRFTSFRPNRFFEAAQFYSQLRRLIRTDVTP